MKVYCFNSKASTWWDLNREGLSTLPVSILQLQWDEIQALAKLVNRTMDATLTVTSGSVYVATELGECEVAVLQLQ